MKTIVAVLLVFCLSTPAMAQGFLDIPPSESWTKVQSGEVDQWSIIPTDNPSTRIDFVSYVENGVRTSYYLVRTTCANGAVSKFGLKLGNRIGLGINCQGDVTPITSAIVAVAPPLPPDAQALIAQ